MTNYDARSVDEFIAAAPDIAKPHLTEIRTVVESALPEFESEIGYGKPYYKHHGWVVGFDAYQHHIGIEIWDGIPDDTRALLEEQGYKTGSVTFQVRFDQPVPADIISRLVAHQVRKNEEKSRKA